RSVIALLSRDLAFGAAGPSPRRQRGESRQERNLNTEATERAENRYFFSVYSADSVVRLSAISRVLCYLQISRASFFRSATKRPISARRDSSSLARRMDEG